MSDGQSPATTEQQDSNSGEGELKERMKLRTSGSKLARRVMVPVRQYIRAEESEGWPLIVAAVVALVWANSPWSGSYQAIWETKLALELGSISIEENLRHAINEFLMPLFFFVIGLEVKHALTDGELSSWRRAAMPFAIGAGGMLVPVACYLAINAAGGQLQGWGVPIATDVAFALAVLTLLGDRIPTSLKVMTLAFAAVDDVGGVLAIAVWYGHGISPIALAVAGGLCLLIVAARALRIRSSVVLALLSAGVLLATYQSGIHTTVAGVVLGVLMPVRPLFARDDFREKAGELIREFEDVHCQRRELEQQPGDADVEVECDTLHEREDRLLGQLAELVAETEEPVDRALRGANPWVSYLVLPLFALANAGVALDAESLAAAAASAVTWGVVVGLVFGKPIGILAAAWLAQRSGIARLPQDINWRHLTGMSLLAGIGFTVSLFIAELAFDSESELSAAKLGVVAASAVSAVAGVICLLIPANGSAGSDNSATS